MSLSNENEAIESLIEMGDSAYIEDDWRNAEKSNRKNHKRPNYIKLNKDQTQQIDLQYNSHTNSPREAHHNLYNRFKRANSLFDASKFLKEMPVMHIQGPSKQKAVIAQIEADRNSQTPKKESISSGIQESGRSSRNQHRRLQLMIQHINYPSNELANGEQSVMLKVQSYQEGLSKKETEYLMNKAMGPKDYGQKSKALESNLLQRKDSSANESPKKSSSQFYSSSKPAVKNLKGKLSNSTYLSSVNNSGQSKSLDGIRSFQKDNMSVSIRYLLNSLQSKIGGSKVTTPFDITQQQTDNLLRRTTKPGLSFNGLASSSYKNIDKEKLYRIYEAQQMRLINNRSESRKSNQAVKKIPIFSSEVKGTANLEDLDSILFAKKDAPIYINKSKSESRAKNRARDQSRSSSKGTGSDKKVLKKNLVGSPTANPDRLSKGHPPKTPKTRGKDLGKDLAYKNQNMFQITKIT